MNSWRIPELPKEPPDEWWAEHYADDEELEQEEIDELEILKEWESSEKEFDGKEKQLD